MPRITGIRRDESNVYRTGIGDNWHTTWANDGKQYTALCDGVGWPDISKHGDAQYNTRVYTIEGEPPDHTFGHLPGFPDLFVEAYPNVSRYYGFGILALDGCIYHFMSTPNHPFSDPDPRFVGAKLIYSPDNGASWRNQDGSPLVWEPWDERTSDNMAFFYESGDAFALLTMLQMGRDYEHNTDGYAYGYTPNGNVEGTMNQLVMFRVPKGDILDTSAYEYFVAHGANGDAEWTHDIAARGVVHTFPSGWVNTGIHPYSWHPSVVYNAPLGVYMMLNWGMGCAEDGAWFGKPSYFGMWTAPQPWGPWTQVFEDDAWTPEDDPAACAYQPQILPAWIADDGLSFWMVHTDFRPPTDERTFYSFNCQRVDILTG